MADHQRIHPVDLEAGQRPSAPLVPGNSFRSDKGDPALADGRRQHLPPPPRRVAPPAPLPPPKRRHGCCCRCICCTVVTVVVLAVLAAAALGALYLVFDPKAPRYSVDRLSVSAFQVDPTLTASARFDVTVTATNPNGRIGIYYEGGSSLSVWYDSYRLAQGALPAFYQGHRNTTVLGVVMAGQAQLGSAVMSALQDAQRTGAVPLVFRADVPVRVELGSFKLWKVTSRVRCDLVVDSLNVNNQIKIKASNCKFSLKLSLARNLLAERYKDRFADQLLGDEDETHDEDDNDSISPRGGPSLVSGSIDMFGAFPKDEPNELPEKHKNLLNLFNRMESSIRLLRLRKKMITFKNIDTQVEVLTKRKLLYTHLAQMKHLFPEAIQIKKILLLDEKSLCMTSTFSRPRYQNPLIQGRSYISRHHIMEILLSHFRKVPLKMDFQMLHASHKLFKNSCPRKLSLKELKGLSCFLIQQK